MGHVFILSLQRMAAYKLTAHACHNDPQWILLGDFILDGPARNAMRYLSGLVSAAAF